MLNEIIAAMVEAIMTLGTYKVYTSNVTESFDKPYFVLTVTNISQSRSLPDCVERTQTFILTYHPESEDETELRTMTENLFELFEYISVRGNLIRGTNIVCKITNGTLQCTVEYNLRLKSSTIKEKMQEINTKGLVK